MEYLVVTAVVVLVMLITESPSWNLTAETPGLSRVRLEAESPGCEVVTAENGEQGIAVYLERRHEEPPQFDLILMDIQMPVLTSLNSMALDGVQDEYGTAAYKTVELDDKLGGRAVQYREVEGGESDRFARLFPQGLRYLAGGTASGFKHVDDAAEREPVLLRIKGLAGNVAMRQVKLSRTVMNSGDCYVMDTPQCIYQWNGKESSAHERAKASELCRLLQQDKHRDTKVLDEGTPEGDGTSPECSNHGFWRHLPGERRFLGLRVSRISIQDESAGGSDGDVKAFEPLLLKGRRRHATLSRRVEGQGTALLAP